MTADTAFTSLARKIYVSSVGYRLQTLFSDSIPLKCAMLSVVNSDLTDLFVLGMTHFQDWLYSDSMFAKKVSQSDRHYVVCSPKE